MSNAGVLNRRITLQMRATTQDTAGEQSHVWSDLMPVWAGVEPLSATEQRFSEAVQSLVTHQITIRYQAQFANPKTLAAMRATMVKDGVTRIFNITGGRDEKELRHFIVMDAVEGLNDG